MIMYRTTLFAAAAAALSSPLAARQAENPAAEQQEASSTAVELTAGVEYQEGRYGTAGKVEMLSAPVALRVATGRLQFGATLPYVRTSAPGNVVGGGGLLGLPPIVDPTRPATRQRREGLGDLKLAAAYTVPSSHIGLTFTGQVKVPTASAAKGLGTGEADYALGAEISRQFGAVTPFGAIGYTLVGDPEGYDLRNSLSARAGAALQMSESLRGHVSYGYAQSTSPLVADERQILTGLHARLSQRLSLGVYGSAGLSEGAPDVGAGLQLGFRIR
jgi:opacity protein-like surface antigen